jgi:hypothetical protein
MDSISENSGKTERKDARRSLGQLAWIQYMKRFQEVLLSSTETSSSVFFFFFLTIKDLN